MDQALYLRIVEIAGYVGTVLLPLGGLLLWLKFTFLVSGPGRLWMRMPGRIMIALLLILTSPVALGWLAAKLISGF